MKKKPLEPHYSGDRSHGYWRRIRLLPQADSDVAYALGCVLQDVEGRVLNHLRNAEIKVRAARRGR